MTFCTDDLLKDGTAAQSTTWDCPPKLPGCTTYSPNNAVDGDTGKCTRTAYFGDKAPYETAWWYVDLGGIMSVYSVKIQFNDYGQEYGNGYCYTCTCEFVFIMKNNRLR
jgi:hypothetical protein